MTVSGSVLSSTINLLSCKQGSGMLRHQTRDIKLVTIRGGGEDS